MRRKALMLGLFILLAGCGALAVALTNGRSESRTGVNCPSGQFPIDGTYRCVTARFHGRPATESEFRNQTKPGWDAIQIGSIVFVFDSKTAWQKAGQALPPSGIKVPLTVDALEREYPALRSE